MAMRNRGLYIGAVTASIALAACSGSIDTPTDVQPNDVDESENTAGASQDVLDLGDAPMLGEGENDELLAEVHVNDLHSVQFWSTDHGVVAIEERGLDSESGLKTAGFSPSRDTYEALYRELVGSAVDSAVLTRLRAEDARLAETSSVQPGNTTENPDILAELGLDPAADGALVDVSPSGLEMGPSLLVEKGVNADIDYWKQRCVARRKATFGIDVNECWTDTLLIAQTNWTLTRNFVGGPNVEYNYGFLNTDNAEMTITLAGRTCAWSEDCRHIWQAPYLIRRRSESALTGTSGMDFYSTAVGKSFGAHIMLRVR